MAGAPCRNFTLMDGMILVAVGALGIVGARDLLVGDFGGSRSDGLLALAELGLMLASCWMVVVRLRRPRPPLVEVVRQPGAVACFSVAAVMVANDAIWLGRSWLEGGPGEVGPIGEWTWLLLELPDGRWAWVVPIGWMMLILGRRWRPEPGWIDRAGRAVGWGWIAWGIAGAFL